MLFTRWSVFSPGLNSKLVNRLLTVPWLGGQKPLMDGWGRDNDLQTGNLKSQGCAYVCLCAYVCVCMYVRTYVCMYVCYVCMYVC